MKAFECVMCGTCCFGEGGIFLEPGEIALMAAFLGKTPEDFISAYCETIRGRPSIKTGKDGYCTFYNQKTKCGIHPVKPRICTLWPFYPALLTDEENLALARDACPGINANCTLEDFVRQAKETQGSKDSRIQPATKTAGKGSNGAPLTVR